MRTRAGLALGVMGLASCEALLGVDFDGAHLVADASVDGSRGSGNASGTGSGRGPTDAGTGHGSSGSGSASGTGTGSGTGAGSGTGTGSGSGSGTGTGSGSGSGGPVTLAQDIPDPLAIALDANNVYFGGGRMVA